MPLPQEGGTYEFGVCYQGKKEETTRKGVPNLVKQGAPRTVRKKKKPRPHTFVEPKIFGMGRKKDDIKENVAAKRGPSSFWKPSLEGVTARKASAPTCGH